MAKSVSDIIGEAKDLGIAGSVRKILIAGPIATAGYGLSYGIDSLQYVFTKPMEALGLGGYEVTLSSLTGMADILDAGAMATANNIMNQWGLLGWLVALGVIIAGLRLLGWAFDRMDIDFLSGVDVPILGRFVGTTDEE